MITGILFAISIGLFAGYWKSYTKAGKPGWGYIIPIYNVILLLEIAGRPIWWIIPLFLPVVNILVILLISRRILEKEWGSELVYVSCR